MQSPDGKMIPGELTPIMEEPSQLPYPSTEQKPRGFTLHDIDEQLTALDRIVENEEVKQQIDFDT